MANFDQAIDIILKHEGGFVDNPSDPGGATQYGISLRYLKTLGLDDGDIDLDGDIDSDDIRKLDIDKAKSIYQSEFWNKRGYYRFTNQDIATKVFDMSVNMGHLQAIKLLQRACNRYFNNTERLKVDGMLGNETIECVNQCEPQKLLMLIRSEQVSFYTKLIAKNSKLEVFRNGWLKRAYA